MPTTINAEVKDTEEMKGCMELVGLDWTQWLLIEHKTLRAMHKDTKGYKEALVSLTQAQMDVNHMVKVINDLNVEKYVLEKNEIKLKSELFLEKNPPWYKHPVVWGVIGLAVGTTGATLAWTYGGAK